MGVIKLLPELIRIGIITAELAWYVIKLICKVGSFLLTNGYICRKSSFADVIEYANKKLNSVSSHSDLKTVVRATLQSFKERYEKSTKKVNSITKLFQTVQFSN
jgi:hypothetical protein